MRRGPRPRRRATRSSDLWGLTLESKGLPNERWYSKQRQQQDQCERVRRRSASQENRRRDPHEDKGQEDCAEEFPLKAGHSRVGQLGNWVAAHGGVFARALAGVDERREEANCRWPKTNCTEQGAGLKLLCTRTKQDKELVPGRAAVTLMSCCGSGRGGLPVARCCLMQSKQQSGPCCTAQDSVIPIFLCQL